MAFRDSASKLTAAAIEGIRPAVPGVFAAAALLAYLFQPLVPLLPSWTAGWAVWTGLCILGVMSAIAQGSAKHTGAQATLAISGIVALVVAFGSADDTRAANDRRCFAIQQDMLSAQPRRSDGPELFQALGCRPQGEGSVFARSTKLERKAGHPLPEGGRR